MSVEIVNCPAAVAARTLGLLQRWLGQHGVDTFGVPLGALVAKVAGQIEPISLYHHNHRVDPKGIADRMLHNGHVIVGNEPFDIRPPYDWGHDKDTDVQWIIERNGFYHLDNLLQAFERTDDPSYFVIVRDTMLDWIDYNIVRGLPNRRKWYDITSGIRAMFLAHIIDCGVRLGLFDDEQCRALLLGASEHLARLADPRLDHGTNHTVFLMAGVMAIGAACPYLEGAVERAEHAAKRFDELFVEQFGHEGVHREQSPYYHLWVSVRFAEIARQSWAGNAVRVRAGIDQAKANYIHFFHPDGALVGVGDSCRTTVAENSEYSPQFAYVHSRGQRGAKPDGADRSFLATGFAIFRSGWDTPSALQSYLFFNGSFQQHSHKQADDLTFEWSDFGRRIIVDSGKLSYNDHEPYRQFMVSTRAHNTIEVNGADYAARRKPYGSAIRTACRRGDVCEIDAGIRLDDQGVVFDRRLALHEGRWLVLLDVLSSPRENSYTQWLHFHPDFEVGLEGARAVARSADGVVVQVLSDPSKAMTVTRGATVPRIQGFLSPKYGELIPNAVLGVAASGDAVRFATVLRITKGAETVAELCDLRVEAAGPKVTVSWRYGDAREQVEFREGQDMAETERGFDHKAYWLERHEKYRDDWRSIGRLALTDAENRASHASLLNNIGQCRDILFPRRDSIRILDLACGVGRLAPAFSADDAYLGVDISPVAIEQARRDNPGRRFEVGSITDFRVPGQTFDLVIASYVLVHMIDEKDWMAALRTLKDNCAPGGAVLILDTVPPEKADRLSEFALRRSRRDFEAAFHQLSLRFTDEIVGLNLKEYHAARHA